MTYEELRQLRVKGGVYDYMFLLSSLTVNDTAMINLKRL